MHTAKCDKGTLAFFVVYAEEQIWTASAVHVVRDL